VVASALAVTCLSSITFLVAIVWEAAAAMFTLHLPIRVFFGAVADMIHTGDFVAGVMKTAAYGVAISIVSTAAGLGAEGGTRGGGKATARTGVLTLAGLLALLYGLTP